MSDFFNFNDRHDICAPNELYNNILTFHADCYSMKKSVHFSTSPFLLPFTSWFDKLARHDAAPAFVSGLLLPAMGCPCYGVLLKYPLEGSETVPSNA